MSGDNKKKSPLAGQSAADLHVFEQAMALRRMTGNNKGVGWYTALKGMDSGSLADAMLGDDQRETTCFRY